ncbi:MAG TPA: hypothetical protein VKW08_13950 [Xanthobacteraceae bacterium]|jgi:hypothetical protein|nr:hypothetical protein [Xanthobacteraceae bacterium]
MLFRVAVVLIGLCAVDAYFFRGQYLSATVQFVQNFGSNMNDGISQFTRKLQ